MIDEHKTLAEKFLKKGFWLYIFSFIIAPIGYIIKIIISGELEVYEVGIIYGIISLITMISAYNDLGLTDSLNFFVPKFITEKRYDKVKTILTYAIIAQMTTGISIALFFFFGADFLANNYFKTSEAINILKIFAFFFIGINIFQIISTFFMVVQNTFYNKLIELFRMGFVLVSVLYVFFADLSSMINYSYSWLFGLYLGIIFAIYFFIKNYYTKYFREEKIIWDKDLFKIIFKYALTIFIGSQAGVLLSQVDMQMIILLLGTTDAGYYTNYLSIIGIPFVIIGPIFGLLYPIFSEMHAKGEIEKIKLVKNIFQKNFLIIGISFNILFFIFAHIIAYILFGEKFLESGVILQYSILFLFFNFLLQMNFNIMGGIGKVKERVKIIFIALFFNIIMNFILIKTIGVYGAALATGLGWVLIWVLSEYYLGKDYKVNFNFKYLGKNIVFLSFVGLLMYYFIVPLFEGVGRLEGFLMLGLISLVYFTSFVWFNWKDFRYFYDEVRKLKKGV